jgi:hypothetical protein
LPQTMIHQNKTIRAGFEKESHGYVSGTVPKSASAISNSTDRSRQTDRRVYWCPHHGTFGHYAARPAPLEAVARRRWTDPRQVRHVCQATLRRFAASSPSVCLSVRTRFLAGRPPWLPVLPPAATSVCLYSGCPTKRPAATAHRVQLDRRFPPNAPLAGPRTLPRTES